MNKKGFTLIETMIALSLSLGTMTTLLVIPRRMMNSQEHYHQEVQKNLTNSTISLYLNEDLASGSQPIATDSGFMIGDSEYILSKGKLSRTYGGKKMTINEVDVDINQTPDYLVITDNASNSTRALNIKVPLKSNYYPNGGAPK